MTAAKVIAGRAVAHQANVARAGVRDLMAMVALMHTGQQNNRNSKGWIKRKSNL